MTSQMRDNRGFSLIELLVSVLLMSIVLGLSASALTDAMKADEAIGLLADANQNMQSASTMMVRDLVDAGRNLPIGGLGLPVGPGTDVVRPGPASVAEAGWPDTGAILYAVTPGNEIGPTINGNATDNVTIISSDDRVSIGNSTIAVGDGGATVTMAAGTGYNSNTGNTIRVGDLMLVTRGGSRAVLYVTGVNAGARTFTAATDGDPSNFNQQDGTAGSMEQLGSTVPDEDGVLTPDTGVSRITMITYWVEESGGMPYLMRQENYRDPVQVGLGVENLELAYDVIDGADIIRVSDPFVDEPGTTPNLFDKAHLTLAVRSDKMFRQTKNYLRNDLTTQVSLRSLQVQKNFM